MREVEVKYRVRDLDALTTALNMRGIALGEPSCQDDQAYAPNDWAYGDDCLNYRLIRAAGLRSSSLRSTT